jgi:hypothetical protein
MIEFDFIGGIYIKKHSDPVLSRLDLEELGAGLGFDRRSLETGGKQHELARIQNDLQFAIRYR